MYKHHSSYNGESKLLQPTTTWCPFVDCKTPAKLPLAKSQSRWTVDDWSKTSGLTNRAFYSVTQMGDCLCLIDMKRRIAFARSWNTGRRSGSDSSRSIRWESLESFVPVETSVTCSSYVHILGDHPHPFVTYFIPHNEAIFHLYNSELHGSRVPTHRLARGAIQWVHDTKMAPWIARD